MVEVDSSEYSYRPGTSLFLYEPATMRKLPPVQHPDTPGASWDRLILRSSKLRERLTLNALQVCYEHDIPWIERSDPSTLVLESSLATGKREERPVQVWTPRFKDSADLLVARIYDPLYFDVVYRDRFAYVERAVAIEQECYSRMADYGGLLVPHYVGLFVVEVPGPQGPRHVYAILLRHIPGPDIRQVMDHGVGLRTCPPHQAAIIDAAARILYRFFRRGIFLKDLKDANTILQLPETPSTESFCPESDCPMRNLIRMDFTFDPSAPDPPPHPYAPRAFLIDMELAVFYTVADDSYLNNFDIIICRRMVHRKWVENDYLGWVKRGPEMRDLLEPDWRSTES
ncbi:hypothetical protein C8R46DRAFT_1341952, partial [Mycena filopes]